jgi:outer membrane protein
MRLSHDGRIALTGVNAFDVGSLDLTPITATVQWHFAQRTALLAPYVGAGISYVMADDIASDDLRLIGIERVEIDSGVALAGQAGLDIALGRGFAVAVDAKYIRYRPDSAPPGDPETLELELDPLIFSAGLKLRW